MAALAACLFLVHPSVARQDHVEGARLLLGESTSVRTVALGGAFVFDRSSGFSGGRDADALFHHPAALGGSQGLSANLIRYAGATTLASVAGGRSVGSTKLGIGLQAAAGARSAVSAAVGAARSVKGIDVGIAFKLVDERNRDEGATVAAVDAGISRAFGPVRLALSARNLGPGLSYGTGKIPLPSSFVTGGALRSTPIGPLDLVLVAELAWREERDWIPGAGVELSWWPVIGRTITVRGGWRRRPDHARSLASPGSPWSLGAGYANDTLAIDYAFIPGDSPDRGHAVAISWR